MEEKTNISRSVGKRSKTKEDRIYGIAAKLWVAASESEMPPKKKKRYKQKNKKNVYENVNKDRDLDNEDTGFKIGEVFSLPLESYLHQKSSKDALESVEEMLDAKGKTAYLSQVKCKPSSVVLQRIERYLNGQNWISYKQWKRKVSRCGQGCRIKHTLQKQKVNENIIMKKPDISVSKTSEKLLKFYNYEPNESNGDWRFRLKEAGYPPEPPCHLSNTCDQSFTVGRVKTDQFIGKIHIVDPTKDTRDKDFTMTRFVIHKKKKKGSKSVYLGKVLGSAKVVDSKGSHKKRTCKRGRPLSKNNTKKKTHAAYAFSVQGKKSNIMNIPSVVPSVINSDLKQDTFVNCQVPLPDINNLTAKSADVNVSKDSVPDSVTAKKSVIDIAKKDPQSQFMLLNVDGKNIIVPAKFDDANPKAYVINENSGTVVQQSVQPISVSFQPEQSGQVPKFNIINSTPFQPLGNIQKNVNPTHILQSFGNVQQTPNLFPTLQTLGNVQQKLNLSQTNQAFGHLQQKDDLTPTIQPLINFQQQQNITPSVKNQSAFIVSHTFGNQPYATSSIQQHSKQQHSRGITGPVMVQQMNNPSTNFVNLQPNISIPILSQLGQQSMILQQQQGNKISAVPMTSQGNYSKNLVMQSNNIQGTNAFLAPNVSQAPSSVTAKTNTISGQLICDASGNKFLIPSINPSTNKLNTQVQAGQIIQPPPTTTPSVTQNQSFILNPFPTVTQVAQTGTTAGQVSQAPSSFTSKTNTFSGQLICDASGNKFLIPSIDLSTTKLNTSIQGGQVIQPPPTTTPSVNHNQAFVINPFPVVTQMQTGTTTGPVLSGGNSTYQPPNSVLLNNTNNPLMFAANHQSMSTATSLKLENASVKRFEKQYKAATARSMMTDSQDTSMPSKEKQTVVKPDVIANTNKETVKTYLVPIQQEKTSVSIPDSTPMSTSGYGSVLPNQLLLSGGLMYAKPDASPVQTVASPAIIRNTTIPLGTLIYSKHHTNNIASGIGIVGNGAVMAGNAALIAGSGATNNASNSVGITNQNVSAGGDGIQLYQNVTNMQTSLGQQNMTGNRQTPGPENAINNMQTPTGQQLMSTEMTAYSEHHNKTNTIQAGTRNNQPFISPTQFAPVIMNVDKGFETAPMEKPPKVNKRKSRPPVRKDYDEPEIEDSDSLDQDYSVFILPENVSDSPTFEMSCSTTTEEKSVTIPTSLIKYPVNPLHSDHVTMKDFVRIENNT